MTPSITHKSIWALVRRQHGVIARWQLLELGVSIEAIRHRLARRRLRVVWPGVYAVGGLSLSQEGIWMAAVLTCGPGALLSHESAAQLWCIRPRAEHIPEVSVPANRDPRRKGIIVHRSTKLGEPRRKNSIPVTSPVSTITALSNRLSEAQLEQAIAEADKLDLARPDELHTSPKLRQLLKAYSLTDSELERRFRALVREAGLPEPETQQVVEGYRVDFLWRSERRIVETDGLRYHRTAAQQARDRERDQDLTAAGFTVLRFTHRQVVEEPAHVAGILRRLSWKA